MRSFSPEELTSIFQKVANQEGLWLPLASPVAQTSASGPDLSLMLMRRTSRGATGKACRPYLLWEQPAS
jgi:hypothetical protein